MVGRPTVSVVTPAYNEAASLRHVVVEIRSALREWTHEIIVVDDGSSDRTWEVIRALNAEWPAVHGVRLTRNFGHQAALVAGLKVASGAAVIMMDSDGQHPPHLLPTFVRRWEEGDPIVQAVRTASSGEGRLKRVTSKLFYRLWSVLSGVPIVAGAADFRLLDRRVVDTLLASGGSLMFLRGLIPWLGYRASRVPFEAKARLAGQSAYTWRRMFRLSLDGLMAFSVVPLRLAMALGISMSAVSFLYLCYIVVVWAFSSRVISGWASTAGLVALVGGIQLFTIGVLGEYVGRIFLRATDRPQFVVADALIGSTSNLGRRPPDQRFTAVWRGRES
jgi:glycosyltransferase involved in cell wall biosynthesis